MRICAFVCATLAFALAAAGALRGEPGREAKAERVAQLIKQLGDDEFVKREAATRALDALGSPALPGLRKAAVSRDLEVRKRAVHLIEVITSRPVLVPKGATVLFDGTDLAGWTTRGGNKPGWPVRDGYVEVVPSNGGDIMTKETFGPDFRLHVEFWLPFMPDKKDQARANSGAYLQGRYEIQILDSYDNESDATASVGALYGMIAPDRAAQKRAIRPPEKWNTYDIAFRAPRINDRGEVTESGKVTVVLNGVKITEGEFERVSGWALDARVVRSGPILLQDHGAKVRFRNIWLVKGE